MRDGFVIYYVVQHRENGSGRWVNSALDHLLFAEMSHADKCGDLGDKRRALLAPQKASSPLWQRYGVHGFERREDAVACCREARVARPNMILRVARRISMQDTHEVWTGD